MLQKHIVGELPFYVITVVTIMYLPIEHGIVIFKKEYLYKIYKTTSNACLLTFTCIIIMESGLCSPTFKQWHNAIRIIIIIIESPSIVWPMWIGRKKRFRFISKSVSYYLWKLFEQFFKLKYCSDYNTEFHKQW